MKKDSLITAVLAVLFVLQSNTGEFWYPYFPSWLKHALPTKNQLQKRVNEYKVHFRFEMYLNSILCIFQMFYN